MSVSNPLITAVQRDDITSVRRLLSSDSININSQGGPDSATPLYYAAKEGALDIVELLLDNKQCHPDIGTAKHVTPFTAACANGNIFVAQHLADHGCNIEKADVDGRSAIHHTAMLGQVSVLKYLIQKLGLDKNSKDNTGHTALHLAVLHNKHRVVSLVIKCKCDINSFNSNGETPLWSACHLGLVDLTKILIHEILLHGNRYWLDEINKDGKSSVYEAVCGKHTEILHYLIKAGADVNICKARDGQKPFTGESALMRAIKQGNISVFNTILEAKGCDIDAPFRGQNVTPLHWAVILDSELATHWRDDAVMNDQLGDCPITYIQIIQKLLEHKPNLDTLDEKYHTALHTAAIHGNLAVVKLLCEHGADINKRCKRFLKMDSDGKIFLTPIEMALFKGHVEVVRYLVKFGAEFIIKEWMKVPELRCKLTDNATLLQWIQENRK